MGPAAPLRTTPLEKRPPGLSSTRSPVHIRCLDERIPSCACLTSRGLVTPCRGGWGFAVGPEVHARQAHAIVFPARRVSAREAG